MRPPGGRPSSRTTPIASRRNTSQELSVSWTAAWPEVSVPGPIVAGSCNAPASTAPAYARGSPTRAWPETAWNTTALRPQGGRHRNPEVRVLVWLEPRAQDAVLATATESGSIPPCGGSPDRGTGWQASPPPVAGHVASR
jgi:hypothetical protein